MKAILGATLAISITLVSVGIGVAGQKGQAGRADKSFSGNGIASIAFKGEGHQAPMGVAETPKGKIVQGVLGPGRAGTAVRYRRGGRIDRSFGQNGKARLAFKSGVVNPRDVLVDRHGRTLVTGEGFRRGGHGYRGAVARLRPDGRPDRSFSGDGITLPGIAGKTTPEELAFGRRGRIVMVGLVGGIPSGGVFVARFLPDGRLDRTFSGDGYRIIRVGSSQSWRSVAVDRQGKIVLGAGTSRKGFWVLEVIRLLPNGRFDRSFSGDGRAVTGPGGTQMQDVTIDRRGRVLAVGSDYWGTLVRFRRNGRLDRSFANNGRKQLPFLSPKSVSVDRKNRIIVAGGEEYLGATVIRLRPNGHNDRQFDGRITGMSYFEDHLLDSRDRIVAAGGMGNSRVGVARLKNP